MKLIKPITYAVFAYIFSLAIVCACILIFGWSFDNIIYHALGFSIAYVIYFVYDKVDDTGFTLSTSTIIGMELVADEAMLYFLNKFDEKGKGFEETKDLLKRKISGDNPSKDEWRKNSYSYSNFNSKTYGYSCAYYNTYDDTNPYYFACHANSSTYANDVANYIISLLNEYIKPIDKLKSKVLNARHKGEYALDLEKLIVNFHPKGAELEKHFGKRMAAMIIHIISTGEILDYSVTKKEVMADLKLTSAKENKNGNN